MCRSKQTPLRRGFLFQGNANELRTVRPDSFHPGVLPRVFWAGVEMARFVFAMLALMVWHSSAGAQDYYWTISLGPGQGTRFSSATSACLSASAIAPGPFLRLSPNGKNFNCVWFLDRAPGYTSQGVAVTNGASCPPGSQYNAETGECTPPEEDKCLPTRGDATFHRHKLGDILLGTIATTPPPSSVCHADCRYSDPELEGKPYRFVSGDPAGAWAISQA